MKIGIIGAGRIGKVHARNITRFVPQLQIKSIADPFMNPEMEQFAKELGIPHTCKDPQELFHLGRFNRPHGKPLAEILATQSSL